MLQKGLRPGRSTEDIKATKYPLFKLFIFLTQPAVGKWHLICHFLPCFSHRGQKNCSGSDSVPSSKFSV